MARVHVELELRWADQDSYGHINNVAYGRFLEEARVRVFFTGTARERTGLERYFNADTPGGPMMLLASQHIEYLRVLEYSPDPLVVELWIGRLGGSSLEVHCEVIDGSKPERTVVARAVSHVVLVDGETMRPMRLDDDGRAAVEAWMDEPLQLRR